MKGITLIETLIYISLLSILMVGVFSLVDMVSIKNFQLQEVDNQYLLQKLYE